MSRIFYCLVVIVFTKRVDAERLIIAADKNEMSRGFFTWIAVDGWAGQLPTKKNQNYEKSLIGELQL